MVLPHGLGLQGVLDTPTPNLNPPDSGQASDSNITRLSSIGLAKTPKTPCSQRVADLVGEDLVGNLPHLLGELKLRLQALGPPKSTSKSSSLAAPTGPAQDKTVTFKCDRVGFQNVVTMVEFCHRLATAQAAKAPSLSPESVMAGVQASLQDMEARMEEAFQEQATALSSSLNTAVERLQTSVAKAPPSFAQAAKKGNGHESETQQPKAPRTPKIPAQPLPQALPTITLAQKDKENKAELDTDAKQLTIRINRALAALDPANPFGIKAHKRVHRTGDIILQFLDETHAKAAAEKADQWVPILSSGLKIKNKTHTIIVHGIPTTFDVTNIDQISDLVKENAGMLDSIDGIRWANPHSIAIAKPFSSIFISLTSPEDANEAIFNKISFCGELKTTERSKKAPGATQCYSCQAYGHVQAKCPNKPRCAICTGDHATESCTTPRSRNGKSYCVNCTEAYIEMKKTIVPDFDRNMIPKEDLPDLAHSSQAANCPIRRAKSAPAHNRDFFPVTRKNATNHAAR